MDERYGEVGDTESMCFSQVILDSAQLLHSSISGKHNRYRRKASEVGTASKGVLGFKTKRTPQGTP